MKQTLALLLPIILIGLTQCVKIPNDKKTNSKNNPWTKLEKFESERPILNMYALSDNLMTITANEFTKFNPDQTIDEKRDLFDNNIDYGTPALSANTFARLTNNDAGQQVIAFHLVKNPLEVIEFKSTDLSTDPNETLVVDFDARTIGAFNFDGTFFLLPVKNLSKLHYTFFLFDIKLDPQTFHFRDVQIAQRIDLTDIVSDPNTISSIKWIGNQFYVATKRGAYRINKDGIAKKVTNKWMIDFFPWNGKIYGTGFLNDDMIVSQDNGLSWQKTKKPSDLRYVKVVAANLVSQETKGAPYILPKNIQEEIFTTVPLKVNEDFPDNNFTYFGIEYFQGYYYLSIGNDLYFSSSLEKAE